MASYPSNYRYGNCIDSYDEEDGIAYEESDLDDDEDEFDDKEEEEDDDDDDNNGCNIDELRVNQKEFSGQFSSLPASSQNKNSLTRLGKDTAENLKSLGDSNEGGLRSRQYVHSVLKPVENLNQWKAVKARGTQPPKASEERKCSPRATPIETHEVQSRITLHLSCKKSQSMPASQTGWFLRILTRRKLHPLMLRPSHQRKLV
ncbi:ASPARTYL/GLUTAMYL-TRNA(ASN/GLN) AMIDOTRANSFERASE SUBUNIT [Salix viminalis]|uniref:ASPARTYL/GLUTAMYL-TRNA(ASN/GLN) AMIDOTRANSFERASE SUBUNIT n=1 Tax=Salix viminalis TaxID=40686 RepID=A0A9Q0U1I0_SALVM|nr:ASPARTYL/GLUTAMYL-TRNA(ASN/GLN) AMIDOTRANSFERASE SUBUNIT [Salix viminalis]